MVKRSPIGKKLRFEVFQRDSFICQYCGSHPPKVILEIDHVIPVSKSGGNKIDNLVTSCFDCNRGKSDKDLQKAPQTLKEKADKVTEVESQIIGYQRIIAAQMDRVETEVFHILEFLNRLDKNGKADSREYLSMKLFINTLGFYEVLEAAEIAVMGSQRDYKRVKSSFLYFCGICRNKMRE